MAVLPLVASLSSRLRISCRTVQKGSGVSLQQEETHDPSSPDINFCPATTCVAAAETLCGAARRGQSAENPPKAKFCQRVLTFGGRVGKIRRSGKLSSRDKKRILKFFGLTGHVKTGKLGNLDSLRYCKVVHLNAGLISGTGVG
jgi:hypothetical protein